MNSAPIRDRIRALLRPGDLIVVAQTMGEPTALLDEVYSSVSGLPNLRMFVSMSLTSSFSRAPRELALCSFVGMPPLSELLAEGRLELIPCHMSALPRMFRSGPLQADVALVTVSPPDADGFCNLGVVSDYIWHAVQSARVVIAEVNENVPVVGGDTRLHVDTFAATMTSSRPLPEHASGEPTSLEREIGRHVATYVRDRSCIQVGLGKISDAVLHAVADRKDLSVHAGMIGDTVLDLMRAGVITNRYKEIDEGITVSGSFLGSHRGVALVGESSRLHLRSLDHTHSPAVVAQISNFVCVNSALEVDIFGQANSEVAGGRYVGGVGGAVDFLRASVGAPNGRAIIALPATASRGRTRIVPRVARVTAPGPDRARPARLGTRRPAT